MLFFNGNGVVPCHLWVSAKTRRFMAALTLQKRGKEDKRRAGLTKKTKWQKRRDEFCSMVFRDGTSLVFYCLKMTIDLLLFVLGLFIESGERWRERVMPSRFVSGCQ